MKMEQWPSTRFFGYHQDSDGWNMFKKCSGTEGMDVKHSKCWKITWLYPCSREDSMAGPLGNGAEGGPGRGEEGGRGAEGGPRGGRGGGGGGGWGWRGHSGSRIVLFQWDK